MRKKETADNGWDFVVESRLKLQSVQRYLIENGVRPDTQFLTSDKFKEKYSGWTAFKKKIFLTTVAGPYWKKMQKEIEG